MPEVVARLAFGDRTRKRVMPIAADIGFVAFPFVHVVAVLVVDALVSPPSMLHRLEVAGALGATQLLALRLDHPGGRLPSLPRWQTPGLFAEFLEGRGRCLMAQAGVEGRDGIRT